MKSKEFQKKKEAMIWWYDLPASDRNKYASMYMFGRSYRSFDSNDIKLVHQLFTNDIGRVFEEFFEYIEKRLRLDKLVAWISKKLK